MYKISSLPDGLLRNIKTCIYALQALLVTIAWILAIAVLTKSGVTGSATKFYFFLTWICIPAFLYLAVVPIWPRTQRFANPYATAAVDVSFTIFWLSACCAVQVWTDGGINSSKGCADFAYGSQSKCSISYASVILGVIVFVLWIIASTISAYCLIVFHKTGAMPNTRPSISKPIFSESQSELGHASNMQETNEKVRPRTRLYRNRTDEEHSSVHTETSVHTITDDGLHPGRKVSWGQDPPLTAPPTYTQSGIPQWRTIHYGYGPTNEVSPTAPTRRQSPPGFRRPAVNAYAFSPPHLHIYPTVNPYAQQQAPVVSRTGLAAYDNLRDVMRGPLPGPASLHAGGYNSAYHTPLPTAMGTKNSWRDEQELERPALERGVSGGRLVFPEADYSRSGRL